MPPTNRLSTKDIRCISMLLTIFHAQNARSSSTPSHRVVDEISLVTDEPHGEDEARDSGDGRHVERMVLVADLERVVAHHFDGAKDVGLAGRDELHGHDVGEVAEDPEDADGHYDTVVKHVQIWPSVQGVDEGKSWTGTLKKCIKLDT